MKILVGILIFVLTITSIASESVINGELANERYNCTWDKRLICENILAYLVDDKSTIIDSEDFEMTVDRNEYVEGFYFSQCTMENYHICAFQKNHKIKFLPIKISDKFPNFVVIFAEVKSFLKIRKDSFQNLNKLRKLALAKNNIETIETGSFDDLVELKTLTLSQNKIKNADENIFKNLVNLEESSIDNNEISVLNPKLFENLRKLKELDISANKLDSIHENLFKNLVNLETLEIQNCDLRSLPETIFENLPELKTLTASKNQLKTLPENLFKNNQNFISLDFSRNKIQKLSYKTFENLPNIKYIALKGNECINADFGQWFKAELINDYQKNQLKNELNEKCSS
ncbi:hypothetical protein PVAND_000082 [Polypedilum vanderplanki]|uniref:Uncharacterized protein n=1 Tax=Polypedilum vanderplanki TaxID=319348 RepID=A0A9J6BIZ6_POLVA|nr:hypothetical protein PVAND_000082 [Polypedilum vanderplanki]